MSQIDLTEVAAAYLEGSLRARDRLRFAVRLATCRSLRRYVGALRDLARIVGYTPRVLPPPETGDRILRHFRGWASALRPGLPGAAA